MQYGGNNHNVSVAIIAVHHFQYRSTLQYWLSFIHTNTWLAMYVHICEGQRTLEVHRKVQSLSFNLSVYIYKA